MTAAAAAPPNALAKRALPIAVAAIAVYPTLLILKGAAERPTAFLRNVVDADASRVPLGRAA